MGAVGTQTVNTTERLEKLRALMTTQGVGAFVVPSEDQHSSEYLAHSDERRAFISGFNGSAGFAIVTLDNAYLFTDGRYFLQAEKQLDRLSLDVQQLDFDEARATRYTLSPLILAEGELIGAARDSDVPTWQEFLYKKLDPKTKIGIDPTLLSASDAESLSKQLAPQESELVSLPDNLVDLVWGEDRPPRPKNGVLHLDEKYSGQSLEDKVKKVREELTKKKAMAIVVTMLDEVAWLFNLRGSDIDFNPVFFSYALVTVDNVVLFVESEQLTEGAKAYLSSHDVQIKPYGAFFAHLKELPGSLDLSEESKILIGDKASLAVADSLGKGKYTIVTPSPITTLKAIKNEVELEGFRQCHIRDGAALARYFAWLEETLNEGKEEITEWRGSEALEGYRRELDLFQGLSFTTISSTGPNGAIIHYSPDPKASDIIKRDQHFGTPTDEEKRAFTRVLQGHIAIDTGVFPNGTTGYLIDSWARRALWQDGLDYRHGTGHGVGHFLNVHEGPQGIGTRITLNSSPLKAGMTVSNEPGYYADGRFGIRIENIVLVRVAETPNNFGDKGYLGFEHVTLCPIHKKLIDVSLLSEAERRWLDDYHRETWEKVSPLLKNDERALKWLEREFLLQEDRKAHLNGKRHLQQMQARNGAGVAEPKLQGSSGQPAKDHHRQSAWSRGGPHGGTGGGQSSAGVPRNYQPQHAQRPGTPRVNGRVNGNAPQPSTPTEEELLPCEQCRKKVPHSEYDSHVENHIREQRIEEAKAELEAAKEDKEGVTVSARAGVDFGILEATNAVEVVITVTSVISAVYLRTCRMETSGRGDEHGTKFSARLRGKSRVIQKGVTRQLSIIFHPAYEGHYKDMLELVFYDAEKDKAFAIARTVEATVGSREDHDQLRPKAPYTRRKFKKFDPTGTIVPSLRPPTWTKTLWKDKLPFFDPPARLIDAAYGPRSGNNPLSMIKRFMPSTFNVNTYGNWFQVLLYLEEERVKLDLDLYSLTEAELIPNHPRYKSKVWQRIDLRFSLATSFSSVIQQVQRLSTHAPGSKVECITYTRTTRMHFSLVNKFNPPRFLFPTRVHIKESARVSKEKIASITPVDRNIGEDAEQMETVAAILNQKPGSVPFIVFGPPGTGKTVTIVEAMQQLLDSDPNARILACAPNNSAVDTIALKLMHRGTLEVFRLNSLSRKVNDMPKSLRTFSLINGNTVFAMPTVEDLAKYRVVVSTCLSAGVPANLGLKRGHFTHIFIDEAGQGKEPELMVPIKSIADEKTNLILAGDNQQLGPIVHSKLAGALGLKKSYLSRIMEMDIYNLDTHSGITIVKLLKNFRSHPDILRFSNENFYKSELQPCADTAITRSLEKYEELPKQNFPIIFHSIVGKDMQEANSPSFFNIDEATIVKKYVISLVGNRKNGTKPEHIGIITPYHAQRCKILDLLYKDPKLRDIKVGSVEEFQGQERRVIIISTVRSKTEFISADIRRNLGFVADKSRLNVALTRAQALLIVIGNPIVLSLDPLWRSFLNYVALGGGWKGRKIDWDPNEPVWSDKNYSADLQSKAEGEIQETVERIRSLILMKHEEDGFDLDLDDDDDAAAMERPILREAE
ncbi:hypothetical protein NLJ89_g6529 [Agrocybe chaxingu]|uniref:RNA helicase n=1 Tax=Agrocybe chaxingu TaxID=84603 RepID=A0A9W8K692_9AGAR|nr:hypothetical protein NLJ89_g6529 [Agrocybe chaxingu]